MESVWRQNPQYLIDCIYLWNVTNNIGKKQEFHDSVMLVITSFLRAAGACRQHRA